MADRHPDSRPVPVTSFAAIAGKWSFDAGAAHYMGPAGPRPGPPYGIALTDIQLRDGEVQTDMSLEAVKNTTGGVILGFSSQTAPYVMAQLGAYEAAYSISEFDPAIGWRAIASSGSVQNLEPDRPYHVQVALQGQRIRFVVDNIPIFDQVLPRPLSGSQVGLFGWGRSPVHFHFKRIVAKSARPRAFVAMQFTEPFDTVYRQVIKPEAEALGFEVVRIDEIAKPGIIFEDMKREIDDAKVVIAEITAPNQNVFYELGYAHALKKPTILLAQRDQELPFDIRSYRVIFYDDSIGGKPAVEEMLRKHLRSVLRDI